MAGKPDELIKADTITADYITGKRKIEIPAERRKGNGKSIVLKGAKGNNLKNVNLEVPLGQLVVVTGISGSGKSSLINGTLYPILNRHFYRSVQEPLPYKSIEGIDNIDKIVDVDRLQSEEPHVPTLQPIPEYLQIYETFCRTS